VKLLSIISFVFVCSIGYSQPFRGEHGPENVPDSRAAGCTPANASTFLEFNNVKALIHTGGNLWQISGQNFSQYEVPKGSGIMALFTSALWLGGVDINGQLKIAAVRYRQGNDYWAGPLSETGEAEIIPSECEKYDRHFVVTQDEVREFDAWFKMGEEDQLNGTSLQAENYPDYEIPLSIMEWPAHGDPSLGQNYYLAPFYDRDEDGNYVPENGDYPWYDIERELDCSTDRTVTLYGDETVWWVMNDKGNIHTETAGDPLGMEIRCQAFAFATNDEINNMTFYNYELVNQSTQTLYDTYFGIFIDGALGGPNDDYVGCDVSRGLGYTYNGNAVDNTDGGYLGYGANPPACGIDFFEGPYQDVDGKDNPLTTNYAEAISEKGVPYEGLGIGYGDGIIDNERMGMRKFLYYNNLGGGGISAQTDPQTGQDYYNYLSGYWKDGTPFVYGGTGHPASVGAVPTVTSNYMFPGESDPLGWGTSGVTQPNWTEQTSGNVPFDRRFAQSSGPFILQPGAVNNITYGVAWARAISGDPFESVKALRVADDKAQALFDNCFKVLEGPHAPDISIQEMENELIISIYNDQASNNQDEDYIEFDPFLANVDLDSNFDANYRFQGYQVYQLADKTVSPADLDNVELARLVFQCDIKDSVSKLVNYEYNADIGVQFPTIKVDGSNEGIRHSFSVTEDQFATGDRGLINFKRYYFMAVSYAHNEFKTFDPNDPDAIDGQKKPYLASRKAAIGEIIAYEGIPHNPAVEEGGTTFGAKYGDEIALTKIDGWGNGGRWTDISPETEASILANNFVNEITYTAEASPIQIKVIDPLNIPPGEFEISMVHDDNGELEDADWFMVNLSTLDTVFSKNGIKVPNEQLIPEWGISVWIEQSLYQNTNGPETQYFTDPIGGKLTYADSSKAWLSGIYDSDADYPTNWIRSGINNPDDEINNVPCTPTGTIFDPCMYRDHNDENELYEEILDGMAAPYNLVGRDFLGMPIGFPDEDLNDQTTNSSWFTQFNLSRVKSAFPYIHGVDLVFTEDQSKWTECAVIENNWNSSQTIGGSSIMKLRKSPSKDINGNESTTEVGRSWFPGYAIDIETGERLNIAFAENSWLGGSNGQDMLWNPTSELIDNIGNPIFGGSHFIYIFGNSLEDDNTMPYYDNADYLIEMLDDTDPQKNSNYYKVWKNCMWVAAPMLEDNRTVLETETRMQLRISHPYQEETFTGQNQGLPSYRFTTDSLFTTVNVLEEQTDKLDLINVVPNPYYAYSAYENNQIDNRVKFTNLPERCTIKIFTMSGSLVKVLSKDNPTTFQDWTLKNDRGIPVASGMYIIHIDVPGVGERILKWYGAMRTVDTTNF